MDLQSKIPPLIPSPEKELLTKTLKEAVPGIFVYTLAKGVGVVSPAVGSAGKTLGWMLSYQPVMDRYIIDKKARAQAQWGLYSGVVGGSLRAVSHLRTLTPFFARNMRLSGNIFWGGNQFLMGLAYFRNQSPRQRPSMALGASAFMQGVGFTQFLNQMDRNVGLVKSVLRGVKTSGLLAGYLYGQHIIINSNLNSGQKVGLSMLGAGSMYAVHMGLNYLDGIKPKGAGLALGLSVMGAAWFIANSYSPASPKKLPAKGAG